MRSGAKRAAAIVIDRALAAIAPLIARRPATAPAAVPARPRVLVVRPDHIGDAVMATAVLRPLREALDPERLDVLVGPWAAGLLDGHPAVDATIVYAMPWWIAARDGPLAQRRNAWAGLPALAARLRRTRYDVAIDLRGDLRQIVVCLVAAGAPVRVGTDRTGGAALLTHVWPYEPDRHEVEKNGAIAALVGAHGPWHLDLPGAGSPSAAVAQALGGAGRFVALALCAREPARSWPAEHAARLVDGARARLGLSAVLLGGREDTAYAAAVAAAAACPIIDLTGRTSLAESLAVFRAARAAVVVDSGPMHVAAAADVPVIALFGPGKPREVSPWTERSRVLDEGAPCGCRHPRCDYTTGAGRCLVAVAPDRVLAALVDLAGAQTAV